MKIKAGWCLCAASGLLFTPLLAADELPKYEVVDLGSLGGRDAFGTDINEAGEVTGWAQTGDGAQHAFLARRGRPMKDLGTLGGDSFGRDINDAGVITGDSHIAAGGPDHAFRIRKGQSMVDLGTLGGDVSNAVAINNAGQITGLSVTDDGSTRPFIVGAGQPMRVIELPPGSVNGRGEAINSGGWVAGTWVNTDSFVRCFAAAPDAPAGDLGTLGGGFCFASDINDSGAVTGDSGNADGFSRAFIAVPGQPITDLGTVGGSTSIGFAINNRGEVTGESRDPTGENRAFLASLDQPMIDLGTLGGRSSTGNDINDAGQVTGDADTSDFPNHPHAFVAEAGKPMIDLGALDGQISVGLEINNVGQVVGWWLQSDDDVTITRTFLATPITLLFARLLKAVQGIGPGKSLANKLRHARAYYDANDKQATCATLQGFSQLVKAQRGKKIKPNKLADELLAEAKAIRKAIGCG